MRRFLKPLALLTGLTALGYGLWWYNWCYRYPYGWSHCCDKQIWFALLQYADEHDGYFPAGEETPEASLSLLYRQTPDLGPALRGKTVPEPVVMAILQRGDLLGPTTCGWHYVEGLRSDDDPRLALFWDKVGLDHNGGRLNGGHMVCRINGVECIPNAEWQTFLDEQQRLYAERLERRALKRR